MSKELNTELNMTTQEIIADLRQNGLTSASIYTRMERAANRLEGLQRELDGLRRVATRPEPSRLEIAAMAMQAFISSSGFIIDIPKTSLEYADALIAAAKGAR